MIIHMFDLIDTKRNHKLFKSMLLIHICDHWHLIVYFWVVSIHIIYIWKPGKLIDFEVLLEVGVHVHFTHLGRSYVNACEGEYNVSKYFCKPVLELDGWEKLLIDCFAYAGFTKMMRENLIWVLKCNLVLPDESSFRSFYNLVHEL